MDPERRQEPRREEDRVLSFRVDQLEEHIRVFAPTATQVAIHGHQIDEAQEERKSLAAAVNETIATVNALKVQIEGLSVRIAVIVALGGIAAGAIASAIVALLTS